MSFDLRVGLSVGRVVILRSDCLLWFDISVGFVVVSEFCGVYIGKV